MTSIFDSLPGAAVEAKPAATPAVTSAASMFDALPGTAPPAAPRKGAASDTVDTLVGGTADAIDLLWTGLFAAPVAAAGEAMTRIQLTANDAFGIGEPMSRRDVSKAGQATAARINEQLGAPVRSTLRALGLLSDRQTTIDKAMQAAMGYVEEKAVAVEKASGGRVLKEDVLMGVNTLFGALGAKGVQYTAKTAVERARAKEGLKELAKIQQDGNARQAAEDAEAMAREADAAADQAANVKAFGAAMEGGRSSPDPRRRPVVGSGLEGVKAPPTADPFGAAASGGRSAPDPRRPAVQPTQFDPFGAAAVGGRSVPDPKRPAASTSGTAGVQPKRDALGTPLSGNQLLGVVGATGLGLAALYAADGDTGDVAAAAAGGALMLGKGRGITLEAIRALPDTTPLREIRDASAYTLNTLENLPGNRAVHNKQTISELLRRQEVTKAERDIVQGVLDATPGDTITAKQLMAGVKEATGDFELAPKASEQFADYGLENIDRASADYYDNPTPAAAALNERRGVWEVFDGNGDVIAEARGATDEASAMAQVQREIADSRQVQDTATTTIYQSPFALGSNNHFGDPNYFAHTRSFYEGGVKHVVEMQSDLAQKAGKVLTPEERAQLVLERDTVQGKIEELLSGPDRLTSLPEVRRLRVVQAEINAKIAAANAPLERVSTMLKRWDRRLVREELAESARKGEPTARFATADTVAKVEGWPEPRAAVEARIRENEALLASNSRSVDRRFVQDILANDKQILEGLPAGRFRPEHQGIYDRYNKEVTSFLRQLGGKEVTDSAGHTWIEVPTEGTRKMPAGKRVQQFGAADPKLVAALGAAGGGAMVAALLSDDENKARNMMLGAVGASLGLFALSKTRGLADYASSVVSGAENYLGVVSTSLGDMSPRLLRRAREHERGVLTRTNDYLKAIGPFVEGLRRVPEALRAELDAAILTGDPRKITAVLGRTGNPALVGQFRQVRGLLDKVGGELMQAGKLKGLLADYYPRIVVDVPGLLKALGQEQRTYIEQQILDASRKTMKEAMRDLTPFETSQIINKALKGRPTGGRPGFLQARSVTEVTPELAKFYAPASESLPLYLRAVSKELERARFFGENLLRHPETGAVNLDESIGNLVREEMRTGNITPEQAGELGEILRSRFGPGERATSAPLQAAKNLAYAGLLGHVTSAITQLGDVAIAAAAHGLLPTLKAIQQNITRKPARATVHELGMIDHMAEEIVGASRTPVTVFGRQVSTAKFLDKVFRYSGFSWVDSVGKNVSIQASRNKLERWAATPAGLRKLQDKYGKAYDVQEMQQLVADLRSGELTELVKGALFSELSDVQPISKLEVPKAYLDNPNGRVLYMLKTFMLKQADIVRRGVYQEIKRGNYRKAVENGLRFGVALGLGGATTQWVNNWILGRDQDPELTDIPLNALKTFGWSQYTLDKVRQGKPLEAVGDVAVPPYKMFDRIIAADPAAIQYLPIVGRLYYARDWWDLLEESGSDRANRLREQAERREEREE